MRVVGACVQVRTQGVQPFILELHLVGGTASNPSVDLQPIGPSHQQFLRNLLFLGPLLLAIAQNVTKPLLYEENLHFVTKTGTFYLLNSVSTSLNEI